MRILQLHSPYFAARWRGEHDVVTWGSHAHCDRRLTRGPLHLRDILRELGGWSPDFILIGDDSNPLSVLGLEDAPCPVAFLSIDAHHNASWHAPLARACERVWVAQRDYLEAFAASGAVHAEWLPLWAPDDLPARAPLATYAVAFVGSLDPALHPERVAFLERLATRVPLHMMQGAYAPVFTHAKVVLNQTVRGDLNARVFEALGCGAFLLTERTGNGLLELFEDGVHLVTYPRSDVDAVVELVQRYLDAPVERAAIAECGRARVEAAHLETHRAATVLAGLATAPVQLPAAIRYGGLARSYCIQAEWMARGAALEPARKVFAVLRATYLEAAAGLARNASVHESDRRAVLGSIALQEGEIATAVTHFASAAAEGGLLEDHLAYVAALLYAGDLRRARGAIASLGDAHPEYELTDAWRAVLGHDTPEAHA